MNSGGVKRTAAPPVPGGGGGGEGGVMGPGLGPAPTKKGIAAEARGRNTNGSGPVPLSYSSGEPADDVNMNETGDKVTLEVVLPSKGEESSPVTVDFNTPMRDLLIHLAATFKVAPTAHVLQLLDPETGRGLEFKPSQTIGALGVSTVYVVPKNKKAEWGKAMKANRASKAFEITNRFTINLPGGQKAVMRISPQMTLEQVFSHVCQDKSLDSRRYTLQHPDNPLAPLDLKATIAESRLAEINVIHAGASSSVGEASRSMPDLHRGGGATLSVSQDPASWYMPGAGEGKKKRGFLSFLSKKDKKFKPHETHYKITETSTPASPPPPPSTTTTTTLPRKASTPPAQRRSSDIGSGGGGGGPPPPRPKSLFVTGDPDVRVSGPAPTGNTADVSAASRGSAAAAPPPGKKRPAPPPPQKKKAAAAPGRATEASRVPSASSGLSAAPSTSSSVAQASFAAGEASARVQTSTADAPSTSLPVRPAPEAPAASSTGLSRLHSRNSSDSSGYHELTTLSGAESPEASSRGVPSALKTSLDTTSIESGADHPNGDSGVQDLAPAPSLSPTTTTTTPPGAEGSRTVAAAAASGKGTSVSQQQQQHQQQTAQRAGLGKPDKKPKPMPSTKKKKAPPPPPKAAARPAPLQEEPSRSGSSQPTPPCHPPISTSVPGPREQPYLSAENIAVSTAVSVDVEKRPPPGDHWDGSDSESGEPFNINDILEAVNFDEEPLRSTTTITTTAALAATTTTTTTNPPEAGEEPERLAMMETDSIHSEDVQVTEEAKFRPCEFIPPPPPEEPPPEDYPPPPEGYSSGSLETRYQDKGTVVGEDNTSLAPASLRGSPDSMYHRRSESRASLASLGSVDTVEGLSLAFAQTIALGQEALDLELWREEQGYANEMARFVAEMSRLTTDRTPDSGDLSSNDTSLSLPDTESASDTGSVIYHGGPCHARGDSKDSQTSFSSLDRPAESSALGGERGGVGEASAFAVMEEIEAPLETVPPPLEFQGGEEEEERDQEVVTVVTEQYILPVGPNGPDYSAAVKVSEKIEKGPSKSDMDSRGGIFRAEPVSIHWSGENGSDQKDPEKPAGKEEFVLTMDDLSSVSMVPPRPQFSTSSKSAFKSMAMESDPQLGPEPEPVAESVTIQPPYLRHNPSANVSSLEHRHGKSEEQFSNFKKPFQQPAGDLNSEERSSDKPLSTMFLPSMRYSSTVEPVMFSDDDRSSESSSTMQVTESRTAEDASDVGSDRPDNLDGRRLSGSSNASQTHPSHADVDVDVAREELQQQYNVLQEQFLIWQQQLQQNQALLAAHSTGSADTDDDTLKTLQAQVQMQQQMMVQLQISMQALAVQQQQQPGEEVAEPVDVPAPAVHEEDALLPSSLSPPSYPPPPPPPSEDPKPPSPPPPPAPVPKVIKAESKPKKSGASRFEPQLDPREELMIAIRSFGGRSHLNAVPTEATKWHSSN